jgi:DHA1 family bicyclomycin/chloramphenicol resistance-like MFS transporter
VTGVSTPVGKTFDNAGFAALLALTTVATATGIDGILPLMPAIGRAFGASQAEVQLTLTTFMLGIAVGQLVHGPISDRFGRKPAILGGLVLNTVATAACAMSTSIEMLMVFRFVHGIAASSGWLIARAVVRDRHERGDAARVISVMMVFHGMSPLISPIVGAHLTVAYGWQAMFVFLSVYAACVTVIFGTLFRETIHAKDFGALRPGPILRNFAEVSRSRSFWAYTACAAASYGILFAFLGTSSHVIISYFGETETHYSYMFAGCMVGSLSGMLMGARLVGRFGVDALLRWGVGGATVFGLLLAGLAWAAVDHWLAVIGPMLFCMVAFAFIFPQSIAGALQPFPHIAGSASSLVGFMQQLIGASTGVTVAALSDGSQLSLANGVLFWAVFGLVAYWVAVRKYRTV